jgi:hypothetical protein
MILLREDFNYPSKSEIDKISNEIPRIDILGFKYTSKTKAIFSGILNEEVKRIDHLFWWDYCLGNRFGRLRQTFEYILVHYMRGITELNNPKSPRETANTLLVDYYSEAFYYFYFTSLDIIAQIINVYFRLNIDEDKVDFTKIKIKETKVKHLLEQFYEYNKQSRELRNTFTHRFSPTMGDFRAQTVMGEDDQNILGFGSNKQIALDTIVCDIKNAMRMLSTLLDQLRNYLKSDIENNSYLFE